MNAFRESARFARFVRPGKQAVKGEHRDLLIESRSRRVLSTIDFEAALSNVDPTLKRIDYFFESSGSPSRCHALEVHPFKPSELMDKKRDTLLLLADHCPEAVSQIASWQVLVKGAMPRVDIAARFRADSKINIAGRNLRIDKL